MNLRDQFKKANLLSDKQAKKLAHEARVERKEKGREQLEQEAQQRQDEVRGLQQAGREQTRREQAELERQRKDREEHAAVAVLLRDAKKPGPGAVKFYFAATDGSLPWLELSPREAQEVRAGQLCVVRSGPPSTHTYRLLPIEAGRRVARVRPDAVAFAPRGVLTA
ncbi:MAG: DUF2058 family protein [Planctomycetes bacterium]|nr:DUF2058 family protein [Planctomycetota bacterium]